MKSPLPTVVNRVMLDQTPFFKPMASLLGFSKYRGKLSPEGIITALATATPLLVPIDYSTVMVSPCLVSGTLAIISISRSGGLLSSNHGYGYLPLFVVCQIQGE